MTEKMSIDAIDAQLEKLQAERKALLEAQRDTDLETVKKLIKQHGFTRTQLRTAFVAKKRGRKVGSTRKKSRTVKSGA